MKNIKQMLVLVPLILCMSSAHAALTTFAINGTFGSTFYPSPGNVQPYPFPDLFGGSLQGSFSYDASDTPRAGLYFSLYNVSIDIRDKNGVLLRTIVNEPIDNNEVLNVESIVNFIFGYSAGPFNDLDDLRINFMGDVTNPTAPFLHGFIATNAPGVGWSLEVASATLTYVSGPLVGVPPYVDEVPVPAAVWLFGSALLGLAGTKRYQPRSQNE